MSEEECKQLDDEYASKVIDCRNEDTENGHIQADDVLCELLLKLGFVRTVEEFQRLPKWYA